MHEGELDQTPAEKAEQDQAVDENLEYWKTQAPLLSAALDEASPRREAGEETQASGQAAAGARAASGSGIFHPNRLDTGAGTGSSADVLGGGERTLRAAGTGAVAGTAARGGARAHGLARLNAVSDIGRQMVGQANSALDTGAKIQAGMYRANVEGKEADKQAFVQGMQSLADMSGSMKGMGGGGGGMGGMGGGGMGG